VSDVEENAGARSALAQIRCDLHRASPPIRWEVQWKEPMTTIEISLGDMTLSE
jgi:hypothetical protein